MLQPTDKVIATQHRHAVLAQFFRWLQVYERPQTAATIQNHLDTLAENVIIETFTHTSTSKENYRQRLTFYQNNHNAHHVEQVAVQTLDHNTLQIEATLLYQGYAVNHPRRNYRVHYQALLSLSDDKLPLFTHIKLTLGDPVNAIPFKDSYAYNRAVSLLHQWLACVETANGDATRCKELLAPDFELDLGVSGVVKRGEQFENWIKTTAAVHAGAHDENNLSVTVNPDGTILLQTPQEWLLVNEASERFARIKKIVVEPLAPLQAVSAAALQEA